MCAYKYIEPPIIITYPQHPDIRFDIDGTVASVMQQYYSEVYKHISLDIIESMQKIADENNATIVAISESVVKEMIELYYEKHKEKE